MPRKPRATPTFRKVLKVTALLWGAALIVMMALGAWAGQWNTLGDTLSVPFTYLVAVGPALGLYLVFRKTASWPAWAAGGGLALAVVLLAIVQATLEYAVGDLLRRYVFRDLGAFSPDLGAVARVVFIYVGLNAFNAAVLWMMSSQEQVREQSRLAAQARIEAAEAKAAALEAELRALRLQLDPHFLFNALNSVASLIATGAPDQAEAMIMKLGEFLRGVLGGGGPKTRLSDELGAVTDYLDVEAVRFPDRIRLDVTCPDDLFPALVPDFILQPLVENSVKYGLASGKAVRIRVIATHEEGSLHLTVEDDGGNAAPPASGFGLGQSTTQRRLASLYGEAASLRAARTAEGYRVVLQLPLEFEESSAGGRAAPDDRAARAPARGSAEWSPPPAAARW